MKVQQVIKLIYYNPDHHIAFSNWRELYLLTEKGGFEMLSVEVYQGKLAYRSKGSHKRITWHNIKKGLRKKEVLLYLPF